MVDIKLEDINFVQLAIALVLLVCSSSVASKRSMFMAIPMGPQMMSFSLLASCVTAVAMIIMGLGIF